MGLILALSVAHVVLTPHSLQSSYTRRSQSQNTALIFSCSPLGQVAVSFVAFGALLIARFIAFVAESHFLQSAFLASAALVAQANDLGCRHAAVSANCGEGGLRLADARSQSQRNVHETRGMCLEWPGPRLELIW